MAIDFKPCLVVQVTSTQWVPQSRRGLGPIPVERIIWHARHTVICGPANHFESLSKIVRKNLENQLAL